MSTSAIGSLSSSSLQQILASALQSAEKTNTASTTATSSRQDSTQLSPFAQLASTLQQLQQSDPTQYKQVTEQVGTNLLAAAHTAQSDGNSSAAAQLSQLAADFTSASQTGQLPNLQDLAQAVGGGEGGGHRHHHSESSQPAALDPLSIISQTLTAAANSTPSSQ